jgi:pSer/pThr/pTyr-binding forkhead associated (FHA) protein
MTNNDIPNFRAVRIIVLRVSVGEIEVSEEAFVKDSITLGRDPYADVYLEDPSVSRIHAFIRKDGGIVTFQDQSSNGTVVNGNLTTSQALQNGDVISVGRFRILVGFHSDDKAAHDRIARSRTSNLDEDRTIRRPAKGG